MSGDFGVKGERFMADNVANPGAAPAGVKMADLAAHQAQLQAAFVQALTEDDIRVIARKLIDQAREGDVTSARLVLKYSLGAVTGERQGAAKPSTRPDPEAAAFVANAAKLLREMDAAEREARREAAAAAAHRPGGPPPGNPRR
jgi:hypothetical protein